MPALPPSPNLQYYRKQAKALVRSHAAGDSAALARVRRYHPRLSNLSEDALRAYPFSLGDAQWVLAREHGFESWPRFKRHLEQVAGAGRAPARAFHTDRDYYEDRARGLVSVHEGGLPSALLLIRELHPGFAGAPDDEIRQARFGEDDARLVYARQHGFADWDGFVRHLEALASGQKSEPFLDAFRAIQAADLVAFRRELELHPELIHARGTNGNTLLNLVAGHLTSGNMSRPPVECGDPGAARMEMVRVLLAAGADVDLANDRGWTPLHQAGYGNLVQLAPLLIDSGASMDGEAHGRGGTPLAMALFWGHREVAELLACSRVIPDNLRIAAGLNRVDLLAAHFEPNGSLRSSAGADREFYRPHSGFPVWHPSESPQEILDEAFVWAAKSGALDSLEFLLARGADPNADPYRGTALTWAATRNRVEAVRWLLAHGAEVDRRGTFGGPSHGQGITALTLAAQCGHVEIARVLVEEAGADPTLPDDLYHSPPWGWAAFHGQEEVRDYLLPIAAQRELFAAVTLGDAELVRARAEEDPDAVNRLAYFTTPLGRAVTMSSPEIVGILLEFGADPDLPDRNGKTPRQLAGEEGRPGWEALVS